MREPHARRDGALDGLRGVAALSVFGFHAWLYTLPVVRASSRSTAADYALHELRLGLVLFFVLSGYLLWKPWASAADVGAAPPAGAFLLRRAARVVPAYYAVLVVSALALWDLARTPGVRLPDAELLALFSVFAQNYAPGSVMKLDPPLWTIAIEVSFYVALPVLGWLALRWRKGVIGVPILFASLGIAWNILTTSRGLGMTWTKTLPAMAPYFACGMLATTLSRRQLCSWHARTLIGVGLVFVAGDGVAQSVAVVGGPRLLPAVLRDLPAAIGFALTIVGVTRARCPVGLANLLATRPVTALGTVSYGLYLWHVPVLLWLRGHMLLPLTAVGATAVALPLSLAIAAASWALIERPAIDWARAHLRRQRGCVGRRVGDVQPSVIGGSDHPRLRLRTRGTITGLVGLAVLLGAASLAGCGANQSAGAAGATAATASARASRPSAAPEAPGRLRIASQRSLPAPVQLPGLARTADGRVVAVGGLDAVDASTATVLVVAPGRPRVIGHLPQAAHDVGVTAVDRTVLAFGGGTASGPIATITAIAPSGATRVAGVLPVAMSDTTAVTVGSTAYVIGGYTATTALRSVLSFGPAHRVRVSAELPHPVRYVAAAVIGRRIYVAGGTTGTRARREILEVDPSTGRVRIVGRLPLVLSHAAGVALNGRFFILGGRGDALDSQSATIWSFDPATRHLRRAGRLPVALSDLASVADGDHVVVVGGRDRRGGVHSERWILQPG